MEIENGITKSAPLLLCSPEIYLRRNISVTDRKELCPTIDKNTLLHYWEK
jgi:hypothetical protein